MKYVLFLVAAGTAIAQGNHSVNKQYGLGIGKQYDRERYHSARGGCKIGDSKDCRLNGMAFDDGCSSWSRIIALRLLQQSEQRAKKNSARERLAKKYSMQAEEENSI